MNDWKGDMTPVLTAYSGEAYERGANITTVEVHVPCRYLLTTYLPLCVVSKHQQQPTYDFFLDPFFPLYFFAYYSFGKRTLARHRPDRMHVACRERCPG